MPSRTEIVISFGEIIECLPPGKQRRKRYNSFDANIGNEENLDPDSITEPCETMKPQPKKVNKSRLCDDTDDEISFRDVKVNGDEAEDGKAKNKRKSNTQKFLEDNANYFQLEVLNSKTRSNKTNDKGEDSDEDSKDGFHTSFLDFLKSKGVAKESGRSRHKSADDDKERSRNGRSRSSFKRYGRSRSSGRSLNGRSHSGERRRRKKSLSELGGHEVFASESDSESSVRLPRLDLLKSRLRSASPSECSDSSVKSARHKSSKSSNRDASPSDSVADITRQLKNGKHRPKSTRVSRSSARESTPDHSRPRRSGRREVSPAVSESESLASTASKSNHNKDDSEEDDDEDDDEDKSPSKRRGRQQGRRSELDKLLEAVDTSFHFETAAAERKRLSESGGSGLGPLEIDCSDTGSETSCKVATKRKLECVEKSPVRKKVKGSNNLLKTASPGTVKSEVQIFIFMISMIYNDIHSG